MLYLQVTKQNKVGQHYKQGERLGSDSKGIGIGGKESVSVSPQTLVTDSDSCF